MQITQIEVVFTGQEIEWITMSHHSVPNYFQKSDEYKKRLSLLEKETNAKKHM